MDILYNIYQVCLVRFRSHGAEKMDLRNVNILRNVKDEGGEFKVSECLRHGWDYRYVVTDIFFPSFASLFRNEAVLAQCSSGVIRPILGGLQPIIILNEMIPGH